MATIGTQFIEEIFNETIDVGLVETQNEFSTKIAGKSPHWYSVIKAEERDPSISSLLTIAIRLERIATQERSYKIRNVIRNIHAKVMDRLSVRTLDVEYENQ